MNASEPLERFFHLIAKAPAKLAVRDPANEEPRIEIRFKRVDESVREALDAAYAHHDFFEYSVTGVTATVFVAEVDRQHGVVWLQVVSAERD